MDPIVMVERLKGPATMSDKPAFLYVATYNSLNDAQADYQAAKALYEKGVIATYDAAIIGKDATGKVHVTKHEKSTQHGGWTGAAIGAVVGLIFPPSIIAGAAVGAGAGALAGHIAKGMSRSEMQQIGNMLNNSTAALVILGESALQQKLQQAVTHAVQQSEYRIQVDANEINKDFNQMLQEMASSDTSGTSTSPNP
jgi:uncharacterized membrane protein